MSQKIKKAVIPVAGSGTRMLPVTKAVSKELLPLVDKPIIQLLVEEAVSAGVEEIIFVTGPGRDAVREYFSVSPKLEKILIGKGQKDLLTEVQQLSSLAKFHFVTQSEPLGDGHAILQAQKLVGDESFLILFGDELIFGKKTAAEQLVEIWESLSLVSSPLSSKGRERRGAVVALQEVEPKNTSKYGIIDPGKVRDQQIEIHSFVEKPLPEETPSNFAIIGKYICPPEIFPILAKSPNSSGEIRLIDGLAELIKTQPVTGCLVEGERHDTGSRAGYVQAFIDRALKHPETAVATRKYLQKIVFDLLKS